MKDVTGKVAFITGGASGMGLAMARSFSAAGMKVAIADIEQDALDRVKAEFAKTNAEVITLKVDVTDRDAMENAARETEAAFGKVHVVCNNAGVAVGGAARRDELQRLGLGDGRQSRRRRQRRADIRRSHQGAR